MSIETLMSAAHAAGYVMVAEDELQIRRSRQWEFGVGLRGDIRCCKRERARKLIARANANRAGGFHAA